jgi:putative transcriptional regulator
MTRSETPTDPEAGDTDAPTLTGQLLIAMPTMPDPRFARTVIYMCAHSATGAMGIVINKLLDNISFRDLLDQLSIETQRIPDSLKIHFGGPVETSRGFVLHTADYQQPGTLMVDDGVGLTASIDILRLIAAGEGPQRFLLALGYAGWAPGQLDSEIQSNGWLHAPADQDLVFGAANREKWHRAVNKLGFDVAKLSSEAGRA